jgi:hypothetical protein
MGPPAENPPRPEHHYRMAEPIAGSRQSGRTSGDSAFGIGLVVNVIIITNVVSSIVINITTLSIITINPDPCPAA